jgi:predicted DNA-binding transcriptional regulator AlpA
MKHFTAFEDRLIDDCELCAITGWAKGTPASLRCRNTLPFPFVRLGKRAVRYRLSDVVAYIERNTIHPKK